MRRWNILWTLLILAGVAATACIGGLDAKLLDCTEPGAAKCHDGYLCDTDTTKVCLRQCSTETDCLAAQRCDVPAGDTFGVCREATSSGGDPAAGDPSSGDPSSGD
ncbi:MAG: hypothetical protein V3T05_12855 [Myxococcota bacterium]